MIESTASVVHVLILAALVLAGFVLGANPNRRR